VGGRRHPLRQPLRWMRITRRLLPFGATPTGIVVASRRGRLLRRLDVTAGLWRSRRSVVFRRGSLRTILFPSTPRVVGLSPAERGRFLIQDGLSVWFVFFTTLLTFLRLVLGQSQLSQFDVAKGKGGRRLLFLLQTFLCLAFQRGSLLGFFVCFERRVLPLFLLVGLLGSREQKITAAYRLFLYTACGGLLMLLAVLYLWSVRGGTSLSRLCRLQLDLWEERILWRALRLALLIKVPMMPFHLWLPEAHVEASAEGSMILAGVVLKLGTYGLLRYSGVVFPERHLWGSAWVQGFRIVRRMRRALICFRCGDIKKLEAYSSISHMNRAVAGMFRANRRGALGRYRSGVSHRVVSPGMFLLVGCLYRRYGTRNTRTLGGMRTMMPLFAWRWWLFFFANRGVPPLRGFPGELLLVMSVFECSPLLGVFLALRSLWRGAYSCRRVVRILRGTLKRGTLALADLTRRERVCAGILRFFTVALGLRPNVMLLPLKEVLYL